VRKTFSSKPLSKFSRKQPEFNIGVVAGASHVAMNLTNLQELFSGQLQLLIKTAHNRSIRGQQIKLRVCIKRTFKERKIENRKKYTIAVHETQNYSGDVVSTKDGKVHSTAWEYFSM
jgi:hypothetical protein